MTSIRKETDSLSEVDVPADKLWGAHPRHALSSALLLSLSRENPPPEIRRERFHLHVANRPSHARDHLP